MDELVERLDFWRQGPEFLKYPKSQWPVQPSPTDKSQDETQTESGEESLEEINLYFSQLKALKYESNATKKADVFTVQENVPSDPLGLARLLENCSSLQTIRGTLTRIKRLAQKTKGLPVSQATPTREEVEFVDLLLARFIQTKHLAKETEALKNGDQIPKGSVLKDLPVYYDDDDQLIRLQSRLHTASSLTFDYANPIIMPKSIFAEKLALEVHQCRFHCSQKTTFNTLRQKYWFCGGFRYVKDIVRTRCKTPRCRFIKYCNPKMSPLPDIRIDNPEPWRNVGVDYLGPIICKHECIRDIPNPEKCLHPKRFKIWMAVFTCLHTRAIHVEVVTSCSTMDFLIAFRRFVAQNGRPLVFYSDQAKHFKAADKQLRQLLHDGMTPVYNEHFGNNCPIEWKFSTETAPWANGCTERLVGIFKKQLKIMLQKHVLTLRQLETIVLEITQSVNDRPLGVTREEDGDSQITPNLLLYGRSLNPLCTPSTTKLSNMPCSDMWIQRKKVLAHFWSKWQAEYLSTLSINKKWLHGDQTVIKPGDVVILRPETLEKGQWRLARVMDIHKNLDGIVTTASVKLPSGTIFSRTLRQIALLEPSCIRLDKMEAVSEESTEQDSFPLKGPVRSGDGFDESLPSGISVPRSRERKTDLAQNRVPAQTWGEKSSSCKYPGTDEAASSDSVPEPSEVPENHQASDQEGAPRSKRTRRRIGYYKDLHEGKL